MTYFFDRITGQGMSPSLVGVWDVIVPWRVRVEIVCILFILPEASARFPMQLETAGFKLVSGHSPKLP